MIEGVFKFIEFRFQLTEGANEFQILTVWNWFFVPVAVHLSGIYRICEFLVIRRL